MTELYNEVADLIRKEVINYSPQLYYDENLDKETEPLAFASSVLIKFADDFFLVTAGHVFHEEDINTIGIMIGHDFCRLGGLLKGFEVNGDMCNPSNADIAIFKLDDETVEMVKEQYQFYELRNSGFEGYFSIQSRYLIFGYPAEMTVGDPLTKIITPVSMSLRTIGADINLYTKDINANKTLILLADQENVASSNNKITNKISDLSGISGCGVWRIRNLSLENPQYDLVSFLIGEDELKTVLYSTRIVAFYHFLQDF